MDIITQTNAYAHQLLTDTEVLFGNASFITRKHEGNTRKAMINEQNMEEEEKRKAEEERVKEKLRQNCDKLYNQIQEVCLK